jgi:hypothetical protein
MKDLGVSPSSGIFPYAFGVFTTMYQSKWDRRMQNFLSLGWTEEQVRKAFVRHPYCMSVSEDKVRQLMTFFVEKLGRTPEYVSALPNSSFLQLRSACFAEVHSAELSGLERCHQAGYKDVPSDV